MPWENRGWDHGDDSEVEMPISQAPTKRTPVYWVAGACVDGVLGCSYVCYKDPSAKKKGLSQKVWNHGASEATMKTAEIEALSKCIQNVQSAGKTAMIIHTTSQYLNDCLCGRFVTDGNAEKIREILAIKNSPSFKINFALVRAGKEINKALVLANKAAQQPKTCKGMKIKETQI